MRFKCGPPKATWWERRERWHHHFAWLPVLIGETWYWLETVSRKGTFECSWGGSSWYWEYREVS